MTKNGLRWLACARDELSTDGHAFAVADEKDLIELDLGADVGDELFDAQGFALRHTVLTTAGDDDCVHGYASVVILIPAFADGLSPSASRAV